MSDLRQHSQLDDRAVPLASTRRRLGGGLAEAALAHGRRDCTRCEDEGERLVGAVAKRQAVTNPEHTIYSIKRFMGRRTEEVPEEIGLVPYKVVSGKEAMAAIQIGDRAYSNIYIHLFPKDIQPFYRLFSRLLLAKLPSLRLPLPLLWY